MLTVISISIEENLRRGLGTESLFVYLGFLKCCTILFPERERETKEEGEKRQMIKFEFINAVAVSTKIVTRVANEACGLVATKRQGFLFTPFSHPHFVVFSS